MEFTLTTFVNIMSLIKCLLRKQIESYKSDIQRTATEKKLQDWILNRVQNWHFLKGSETHMLLSVAVQCRMALKRPPEKTKQHWQATGRGEMQSHLEKSIKILDRNNHLLTTEILLGALVQTFAFTEKKKKDSQPVELP